MRDDWSWKPPKASPELERELLMVNGTACMPQRLRDELRNNGITWNLKGWKKKAISHFGLTKKYKAARVAAKQAKREKKANRTVRPDKGKSFYSSWEWKKARFETLKRYGGVCMCCGSEYRIVVDHIKPRSRYPELALDLDNLQVLCNDCNMGKSNDDETDFRPKGSLLSVAEMDELALAAEADGRLH